MFKTDLFIICLLFASVLTQIEKNYYDDEDIRLPEEATGRPMPPELQNMFANKSARDMDLEVCMGELVDCHRLKHEVMYMLESTEERFILLLVKIATNLYLSCSKSQKVCGQHISARKTFEDICELNYENCKAPIIYPGFDMLAGPEYLHVVTVNPEVELWSFAHDGECSNEVT